MITEDKTIQKHKIPHIIHQVYEDIKGPSESLLALSQTWKHFHPEWEYRFWNKDSIEELLYTFFPEFLTVYRNFPFDVQRWDAIRYLILYHLGGLYVDMDYECFAPLDLLLQDSQCCIGLEPHAHALLYQQPFIAGNALLAAIPKHPYFKRLIDDMTEHKNTVFSKFEKQQILESTGPFLMTRVYNACQDKDKISLLPDELIAPLSLWEVRLLLEGNCPKEIDNKIEKAYAIHYFMGSWHPQVE